MTDNFDIQVFVEEGCETNKSILKLIGSNESLHNEVNDRAQEMGKKAVNVHKTMQNLVAVGKLLQIADLGSDALKSNVYVKRMMMDYQSMVHDSTVTLFKFRDKCRAAIENHVLAIELYNEDAFSDSLSILAENKPLAAEMAEESEKLKNRADKLLKDAVKALEMAQNDDVKCREQKEKIAKKLNELKADMKEKETLQEEQEKNMTNLNNDLQNTWDQVDKHSEQQTIVKVVGAIFRPITSLFTTAEKEEDRIGSGLLKIANEQQNELTQMQERQAKTKAELAKLVHQLENSNLEFGDLETAIRMISMLIHVLGHIKTTFENLKTFWKFQEYECNELLKLCEKNESSLERLAENDGKSKAERMKLKQTVRGSVLKWTTLFKVNHDGFLAIENVKNSIDNVVTNLGNLNENGKIRSRQETEIHMKILLGNAKKLLEVYPDETIAIKNS